MGRDAVCALGGGGESSLPPVAAIMGGGTKQMRRHAERWPRIAARYRLAIGKLWERSKDKPGYARWTSGDDMFDWWLERGRWSKDKAAYARLKGGE